MLIVVLGVLRIREEVRLLLLLGWGWLLLVPVQRHHVVVHEVNGVLLSLVLVEVESPDARSVYHFREVILRLVAIRAGVLLLAETVLAQYVEWLALRTQVVLQAVVVNELALHQLLLVIILKQGSPLEVVVRHGESPLAERRVQLGNPAGRVEHLIRLLLLVLLLLGILLQLLQLLSGYLVLLAVGPLVQVAYLLLLLLRCRLLVLAGDLQLLAV